MVSNNWFTYKEECMYICIYLCMYYVCKWCTIRTYLLKSEGQVSIGMQSDYLRRVNIREFRNVSHKIFHLDEVRNTIHKILLYKHVCMYVCKILLCILKQKCMCAYVCMYCTVVPESCLSGCPDWMRSSGSRWGQRARPPYRRRSYIHTYI